MKGELLRAFEEGRARGLDGRRLEDFVDNWFKNPLPKACSGRRAVRFKRTSEHERGLMNRIRQAFNLPAL